MKNGHVVNVIESNDDDILPIFAPKLFRSICKQQKEESKKHSLVTANYRLAYHLHFGFILWKILASGVQHISPKFGRTCPSTWIYGFVSIEHGNKQHQQPFV